MNCSCILYHDSNARFLPRVQCGTSTRIHEHLDRFLRSISWIGTWRKYGAGRAYPILYSSLSLYCECERDRSILELAYWWTSENITTPEWFFSYQVDLTPVLLYLNHERTIVSTCCGNTFISVMNFGGTSGQCTRWVRIDWRWCLRSFRVIRLEYVIFR